MQLSLAQHACGQAWGAPGMNPIAIGVVHESMVADHELSQLKHDSATTTLDRLRSDKNTLIAACLHLFSALPMISQA